MANLRDNTGGKQHVPKGKENVKATGTKESPKGETKPK